MQLDINEIQKYLPHRYPFLLVDRVVEMERLKRIVAIKNVTINEAFFQGHFPGQPVMPGVLILESMAQAGGMLLLQEIKDRDNKLLYLASHEQCEIPAADCTGRSDARGSKHTGVEGRPLQNRSEGLCGR